MIFDFTLYNDTHPCACEMTGSYLRREKELAEARFEVIQAETSRLRQQVMNVKKQADAAEQALVEERQKTEVS